MKLRRKIISLALLAIITCLLYFCLPQNTNLIPGYDRYVFYPFQSIRGRWFGAFPFSIGDIIYIICGIWLLVTLIRWVRYLSQFRQYKELLAISVVRTMCTILFAYLFFIIGWGANYYKPSLAQSWGLSFSGPSGKAQGDNRKNDSTALVAFNTFLVDKLNK